MKKKQKFEVTLGDLVATYHEDIKAEFPNKKTAACLTTLMVCKALAHEPAPSRKRWPQI